MWRIWLIFDPRRTLVALFSFLFVLALTLSVFCLPGTRASHLSFCGS
ncbi:MAG: light-harvesting protein [Lysobacteraceae bacterium]|nr:MAG: light-harvesting protein [Xanthomonadaceae bacterium]